MPFLWFALRKKIPAGYTAPLAALFLLGGAQGALGWWMVKSGLADRPDVSHYRLAAHLALALCLFAACRWTALTLRPAAPAAAPVSPGMRAHGWGALAMLAITIVWGAFTAGLDAGKIYNSWPLMGGSFLPPENFTPAAFLDGQAWVQFAHRWLAALTGIAVLAFAARTKSPALAAMVIDPVAALSTE